MKQSKNFIYLKGEFNINLVTLFKNALRSVNIRNEITIRINSNGGNIHCMNVMSAFLYYLRKYHKASIRIEIEHVESAALLFAINFPNRIIIASSTGSIHLPTLIEGQHSNENKEEEAVKFIASKTRLNINDVKKLNGKKLKAKELYQYGIATQVVRDFYLQAV